MLLGVAANRTLLGMAALRLLGMARQTVCCLDGGKPYVGAPGLVVRDSSKPMHRTHAERTDHGAPPGQQQADRQRGDQAHFLVLGQFSD